jgi:hypothetical protein
MAGSAMSLAVPAAMATVPTVHDELIVLRNALLAMRDRFDVEDANFYESMTWRWLQLSAWQLDMVIMELCPHDHTGWYIEPWLPNFPDQVAYHCLECRVRVIDDVDREWGTVRHAS